MLALRWVREWDCLVNKLALKRGQESAAQEHMWEHSKGVEQELQLVSGSVSLASNLGYE